ncbi:MAG: hypothetical protein AB2731_07960 [Candidatus Thiodiazotropha sp.]
MSSTETDSKSPSEELADIVVANLLDKGLILESDTTKTITELASGRLKGEDWRLLIEKALDKKVSDE